MWTFTHNCPNACCPPSPGWGSPGRPHPGSPAESQGLLAEDVIHTELLGLATGQLALQLLDPQEAPARRKEGAEVRVGILLDECRAVVLGVSCLVDLTLSNGGRNQGGEAIQNP